MPKFILHDNCGINLDNVSSFNLTIGRQFKPGVTDPLSSYEDRPMVYYITFYTTFVKNNELTKESLGLFEFETESERTKFINDNLVKIDSKVETKSVESNISFSDFIKWSNPKLYATFTAALGDYRMCVDSEISTQDFYYGNQSEWIERLKIEMDTNTPIQLNDKRILTFSEFRKTASNEVWIEFDNRYNEALSTGSVTSQYSYYNLNAAHYSFKLNQ